MVAMEFLDNHQKLPIWVRLLHGILKRIKK